MCICCDDFMQWIRYMHLKKKTIWDFQHHIDIFHEHVFPGTVT